MGILKRQAQVALVSQKIILTGVGRFLGTVKLKPTATQSLVFAADDVRTVYDLEWRNIPLGGTNSSLVVFIGIARYSSATFKAVAEAEGQNQNLASPVVEPTPRLQITLTNQPAGGSVSDLPPIDIAAPVPFPGTEDPTMPTGPIPDDPHNTGD